MTIEEQLRTLLATSQEHTKQLEMDGQFIRQLAQLAPESHEDIKRMTNAMEALIERNANHETRLNRLEGHE